MRLLSILAVTAIILAGCAGEPEGPEEDPFGAPDAQTTSTTGAITGVVISQNIEPVADATVRLSEGDLEVTTGPDGTFVFEGLAPGTYFVIAEAARFESSQTSATVVAGEVSKTRLMLAPDLDPIPRPMTEKFKGRIEAADGWVTWIATDITGSNDLCQCIFKPRVEAGAYTAIFEMTWTPSSELNDPGFWVDHYTPDGEYDGNYVENPARLEYDARGWEPGEVQIQISVGTTVQIQQDVEIFYTVWYDGPAPDGWSIVAGDEADG